MTPVRSQLAVLGLAAAAFVLPACFLPVAHAASSQPVHASFLYPVATSQDPDLSTHLSLSVLYGRLGRLDGLGVNGVVSVIHHGASGLLLTGGVASVNEGFRGIALTGLVNSTTGEVRGLEAAGLANFHRGEVRGVQASSFLNFAQDGVQGAQLGGAFNMADGDVGALQASGFGNVTTGNFRGLQATAGFNYARGTMSGGQVALLNTAGDVHGFQVGMASFAATVRGVTVGVLNVSDRHEGVPVGFVNVARENGAVDAVVEGGTLVPIQAGVRTVVNRFSSIFAAGYGDPEGDVERTGVVSWHPGYDVWHGGRWTGTFELGYYHFMPDYEADPALNDALHFAVEARARLERRFSTVLAAYAGVGVGRWYASYDHDAEGRTLATVHAGVALF